MQNTEENIIELQEVVRCQTPRLMRIPGVKNVAVALKFRKGQPTNLLCIRVSIKEIKIEEALAENQNVNGQNALSGQASVSPSTENQTQKNKANKEAARKEAEKKKELELQKIKSQVRLSGYLIDVVEVADDFVTALEETNVRIQPKVLEQLGWANTGPQETLQSGINIQKEGSDNIGTLGAIVYGQHDSFNEPFILSNAHVIADSQTSENIEDTYVCQGGQAEEYRIGAVESSIFGVRTIDAAIASVEKDTGFPMGDFYKMEVKEIGEIPREIISPVIGMKVIKYGARTGKTEGKIICSHLSPTDFLFCTTDKENQPHVVAPGDSGSIIVDAETKRVVGLVKRAVPFENETWGIASRIDVVLSKLGVRLESKSNYLHYFKNPKTKDVYLSEMKEGCHNNGYEYLEPAFKGIDKDHPKAVPLYRFKQGDNKTKCVVGDRSESKIYDGTFDGLIGYVSTSGGRNLEKVKFLYDQSIEIQANYKNVEVYLDVKKSFWSVESPKEGAQFDMDSFHSFINEFSVAPYSKCPFVKRTKVFFNIPHDAEMKFKFYEAEDMAELVEDSDWVEALENQKIVISLNNAKRDKTDSYLSIIKADIKKKGGDANAIDVCREWLSDNQLMICEYEKGKGNQADDYYKLLMEKLKDYKKSFTERDLIIIITSIKVILKKINFMICKKTQVEVSWDGLKKTLIAGEYTMKEILVDYPAKLVERNQDIFNQDNGPLIFFKNTVFENFIKLPDFLQEYKDKKTILEWFKNQLLHWIKIKIYLNSVRIRSEKKKFKIWLDAIKFYKSIKKDLYKEEKDGKFGMASTLLLAYFQELYRINYDIFRLETLIKVRGKEKIQYKMVKPPLERGLISKKIFLFIVLYHQYSQRYQFPSWDALLEFYPTLELSEIKKYYPPTEQPFDPLHPYYIALEKESLDLSYIVNTAKKREIKMQSFSYMSARNLSVKTLGEDKSLGIYNSICLVKPSFWKNLKRIIEDFNIETLTVNSFCYFRQDWNTHKRGLAMDLHSIKMKDEAKEYPFHDLQWMKEALEFHSKNHPNSLIKKIATNALSKIRNERDLSFAKLNSIAKALDIDFMRLFGTGSRQDRHDDDYTQEQIGKLMTKHATAANRNSKAIKFLKQLTDEKGKYNVRYYNTPWYNCIGWKQGNNWIFSRKENVYLNNSHDTHVHHLHIDFYDKDPE
ncbi:MAG: hypothetical protein OEV42_06655 [Deltaproteobacteria bacterium]|nr:hypothetical protein [Deltaproteobacteria bacterium]